MGGRGGEGRPLVKRFARIPKRSGFLTTGRDLRRVPKKEVSSSSEGGINGEC